MAVARFRELVAAQYGNTAKMFKAVKKTKEVCFRVSPPLPLSLPLSLSPSPLSLTSLSGHAGPRGI
jgi:hypothetical protein